MPFSRHSMVFPRENRHTQAERTTIWRRHSLAAAVLGLALAASRRLERSKYGLELAAIRDAELAARSCGVNMTRLKILAFGPCCLVPEFDGSD
jgi:ABC-type branched-subunit amino acid transport system permease subunit